MMMLFQFISLIEGIGSIDFHTVFFMIEGVDGVILLTFLEILFSLR